MLGWSAPLTRGGAHLRGEETQVKPPTPPNDGSEEREGLGSPLEERPRKLLPRVVDETECGSEPSDSCRVPGALQPGRETTQYKP